MSLQNRRTFLKGSAVAAAPLLVSGNAVMGRAKGNSVEHAIGCWGEGARHGKAIRLYSTVGGRQVDFGHGDQSGSAGTSIHRRCRQLSKAASTSWSPLAPSRSEYCQGVSSTTWLRNCSH